MSLNLVAIFSDVVVLAAAQRMRLGYMTLAEVNTIAYLL